MKSKKRHSVEEALRSVTRGELKHVKIKELQEKLAQVQVEVQLQVTMIMRSENLERLESLITSNKSNATQLSSLRENIQILRSGVRAADLNPEISTQLLHLFQLSSSETDRSCRDYILKGISFPTMRKRYNEVVKAHQTTFTWIVEDDRPSDPLTRTPIADANTHCKPNDLSIKQNGQADFHVSIRKAFQGWLSDGKGIFQIIAKPGASKSTMMKLICNSPETERFLRKWSGRKTLIKAKHFFWKQGDRIQSSMDGMLRALLYDTLSQAPELIAHVLSEQWKTSRSTPWHSHAVPEISDADVGNAFRRLFSGTNLDFFDKYSICIFLDGLDEFESSDPVELITCLRHLATLHESIKLCVSSRAMSTLALLEDDLPWEKLYLHKVTESDIRKVTRDRLLGHGAFQRMMLEQKVRCESLIRRVVHKAEGVFLWVTLILNILCEGLIDDDTLSDLWEKIEFYPDDLDKFLQRIVSSISPENRKSAYHTFAIALQARRGLLLLNYSFMESYTSNRKFAMEIKNDSVLSSKEEDTRLARTQRRLVSHCKALLQVNNDHGVFNAPTVSFIHRSAREAFEQDQIKADMAGYLKDFDVLDAILQTSLAVIKLGYMWGTRDATAQGKARDWTGMFTDYLERVAAPTIEVVGPRCTTTICESLDNIASAVLHRQGIVGKSFEDVEWAKFNVDLSIHPNRPRIPGRGVVTSLVHQAMAFDIPFYCEWTAKKFTNLEQHREAAVELLCPYITERLNYRVRIPNVEKPHWIESLFLMGISANCPQYSLAKIFGKPVWYMMLRNSVLRQGFHLQRNDYFWHIFEIFVRHGADCSLTMNMKPLVKDNRKAIRVVWAGECVDVHDKEWAWRPLHDSKISVVRLQDIIDRWKPDSENILKELIFRNQARERESPSILTLSNRDYEEKCKAAIIAGEDPKKVIFRMRESNWDVSPPTAAEKEAARLDQWATDTPSPYSSEDGIDLALKDMSFLAFVFGYAILSVPLILMILVIYTVIFLAQDWMPVFLSSSNFPEL
ncbi:hypothetical protein ONS95_010015 [Cadophora gregata]|uniref:uncharacterized protein n=1 Tax=Cadophora gregata TaxID=51156 RepID=UPI0026DD577B|nr:uncharacterized protein ONS95_010015 [Cadophora gregata]KAK0121729.1 hypothetical protein ONS95_010015 [Cadophora gregata]